MPLDAPACPVAAHRAPDAPNLSIRQCGLNSLLRFRAQVSRPSSEQPSASLQSAANSPQFLPSAVVGTLGVRQPFGIAPGELVEAVRSSRG